MTQTVRRDRRAERHQASRREIVQAAWVLARERGLAGWSLRDVAEAVGIRAPSLYVYFESKNALYDAMYADGYAELLAQLDAALADAQPEDVIRTGAHAFFDFCVSDAARHQLLFQRTLPGFVPSEESYRLAEEALSRLATALRSAGMDGEGDLDLWTAVFAGLAAQQLSNDPGGNRWGRLVDRAVTMLLTPS